LSIGLLSWLRSTVGVSIEITPWPEYKYSIPLSSVIMQSNADTGW
jgi:hypothetical protein